MERVQSARGEAAEAAVFGRDRFECLVGSSKRKNKQKLTRLAENISNQPGTVSMIKYDNYITKPKL